MLHGDMARSAKDSFEIADAVLGDQAKGSKTSDNKTGSNQRSHLARKQSKRAKKSSEVHAHDLGIAKKFASDAAENLEIGRERQNRRDATKLKLAATRKTV